MSEITRSEMDLTIFLTGNERKSEDRTNALVINLSLSHWVLDAIDRSQETIISARNL